MVGIGLGMGVEGRCRMGMGGVGRIGVGVGCVGVGCVGVRVVVEFGDLGGGVGVGDRCRIRSRWCG